MNFDPCGPLSRGLLPRRFGRRCIELLFGVLTATTLLGGCLSNEYSPSSNSGGSSVESMGGTFGIGATGGQVADPRGGTPGSATAGLSIADGGTRSTAGAVVAIGGNNPNDTATTTAGTSSTVPNVASGGTSATAPNVATGGSAGWGGPRTTAGVAGTIVGMPLTLRDAAERTNRWFGAALASYRLKETSYATVAASEFNYLTPENELKWDATEAIPNVFSFAGGDSLVAFAEAHQMRVKGHTLVWHSQLPAWVKLLTTPDQVRLAMTRHIESVAGHFKGKVAAWDVVNEAIDDGNGNALRTSIFRQMLGDSYIDEAFRLTRGAAPDALLFYNDYGIEGLGSKSNAAYALVKRLREAGVPIDGVGLQMHIRGAGSPSVADITANIQRIAKLGLLINISELDVNLCAVTGDQTQKFAVQQQRYREVIAACVAEPMCQAVTLWGVTDKYSWLNTQAPCVKAGETGWPWGLPWDDSFAKKPAWNGIMDALLGK